MKKGAFAFIFLICSMISINLSYGQTKPAVASKPVASKPGSSEFNRLQDSLVKISARMYTAASNVQRFEENSKFIKLLVTALKVPSSYKFGFDSLRTISNVSSPDNKFRIFSWYVPTEEGTYRFFGTIQMATADGSLKLFPLVDDTEHLSDDNIVTTNKQWYGARYYEIIPLIVAGQAPAYALLGWKGNNSKTSKKVIDILTFGDTEARFGKPIFQGAKDTAPRNRIVFEYNKLNTMTLRLDKKEQLIAFDHLAPIDSAMVGNYEYYASDSSFDAYRLVGSHLKLIENVELNNDPNEMDELYIDPKRKDIPVVKKF